MKNIYLFFLSIIFISCSEFIWGDDQPNEYIELMIVNYDSDFPIIKVMVRDYKFEKLNIKHGTSKTFQLIEGLKDPLNEASVYVTLDCPQQKPTVLGKILDFSNGFDSLSIRNGKIDNLSSVDCGNIVIKQ